MAVARLDRHRHGPERRTGRRAAGDRDTSDGRLTIEQLEMTDVAAVTRDPSPGPVPHSVDG